MIVIIDKANRRLFAHQLEQVSPLRPRDGALVFEGAWVGSLSGNAVNLAEDESVYIADLDRNHTVEAALRLTPARGASLLRDQFSRQFSPACAPEHSQIYEITHWISADLEAEGGFGMLRRTLQCPAQSQPERGPHPPQSFLRFGTAATLTGFWLVRDPAWPSRD